MEWSSAIAPLVGGVLIGLGAAVMLLLNGRIAGISGVVGGLLQRTAGDSTWRVLFVAGLVVGGVGLQVLHPDAFVTTLERSLPVVALAGLLVGFGTRLGNGCTSGHGVCGVSRLSRRSIVATATFIGAGALAVALVRGLFGGAV